MSEKLYKKLLAAVLALCVATTAITVAYTVYLHRNCSIVSYIANER